MKRPLWDAERVITIEVKVKHISVGIIVEKSKQREESEVSDAATRIFFGKVFQCCEMHAIA